MSHYKRPAVVFNLENPMQRDLYDWCMEQSSNFSDFARTVLFSFKQSKISNHHNYIEVDGGLKPSSQSDVEAMADLL